MDFTACRRVSDRAGDFERRKQLSNKHHCYECLMVY